MSNQSIVLSDELLTLYYAFKQGNSENLNLVERLFSYYAPHLTNTDQLERINQESDSSLFQQLAQQGFISQSLEELVLNTQFKFILDTGKSDYPYVNINDDKVEKNFSLTFGIGENRDKLIKLITALCANSTDILIFDSYFSTNWNDTKKFFESVLPKKNLTIF